MRIAVLGIDDSTLSLINAVVAGGHDQIVFIDASAARAAEAKVLAPEAHFSSDWEYALDPSSVDCALVAADQPAIRIEQIRRLIQSAIPTIVSHPVSLSMLECFELEMIREESHGILLAYLPARWHPAAERLKQIAEESSSDSELEQIIFERFLPERNREAVLRQFARDADLMTFIAGEAAKLQALGSTGAGAAIGSYANLAVQITCDREVICRWSVAPVENELSARLTLVSASTKITLSMSEHDLNWREEARTADGSTTADYSNWHPAAMALEKLATARNGNAVEPTWADASRTIELAETIDRSLNRGRAIDLHREQFSDIGTFKGTMTSLGCGLLMAGLGLVILVALADLVAVQAGWNRLAAGLGNWPYLLLAVLVAYLLLQLLVFIGKPKSDAQSEISPTRNDDH